MMRFSFQFHQFLTHYNKLIQRKEELDRDYSKDGGSSYNNYWSHLFFRHALLKRANESRVPYPNLAWPAVNTKKNFLVATHSMYKL